MSFSFEACLAGLEGSATEVARFGFMERVFEVRSNAPDLISGLRAYFAAFEVDKQAGERVTVVEAYQSAPLDCDLPWQKKQPEPGKKKIKEHFYGEGDLWAVKKVLTGVICVMSPSRHVAIGPLAENLNPISAKKCQFSMVFGAFHITGSC